MNNPETIVPIPAPTDTDKTRQGAFVLTLLVLFAPLYLAIFFGFCGLAARAFHYAAFQIGL